MVEEPWYEKAGVSAQLPPAPALWLQLSTASTVDEPLVLISRKPQALRDEASNPSWRYAMPRERNIWNRDQGYIDYGLVQAWINICDERHTDTCGQATTYQRQTLRLELIDLWTGEVKPIYTDEPYVALSYVWGPNAQQNYVATLQPGSGLNHDHPVPLPRTLPRTIKDAMVFTGSIKVRYLWVDILCIDQFNQEEKRSQIEQMHLVYQCAFLTIIALDGTEVDSGLAGVSRPVVQTRQPRVETNFGAFMATFVHSLWSHQGNAPWDQRAWTLQELALSRRAIMFDSRHMFFVCKEEAFNEVMTFDVDVGRVPTDVALCYFWENGFGLALDADEWNFSQFSTLLANYTGRQLSDEDDILSACTGALNQITRLTGVAFAYGMPRSDLHRALLWKAHHHATVARRTGYPTWSWIGWKGRIEYHYCMDEFANYQDLEKDDHRHPRRPGGSGINMPQEILVKKNSFAFINIDPRVKGIDNKGVLQVSSSIARYRLRKVHSKGDKISRLRRDSEQMAIAVGDQWLLINHNDIPVRNLHGGYARFEEADYSFQVNDGVSSQLVTDSFKCEAVLIQYFEWLRDSDIYNNWLDDMVGVLIIRRVGEDVAERIGSLFVRLEDWVAANPQPGVVYLI